MRAIPGVVSAGAINVIPFTNVADGDVLPAGGPDHKTALPPPGRADSQRESRLLCNGRRAAA